MIGDMGLHRYRKSMIVLGAVALGSSAGVALLPGTSLATPKPKVVKTVKVEDDFYSAKKLTIKGGTEIKYVWNKSNFDQHNVSFVSGPKGVSKPKFSSKTATSGIRFNLTFTKKGTYRFKCTIHPSSMRMTVVVK